MGLWERKPRLVLLPEAQFPHLSYLLEGASIPWFTAASRQAHFHPHVCFSDSDLLTFLSEVPGEYAEASWAFQGKLPMAMILITLAKSIVACRITYSWGPGNKAAPHLVT